MPPQARLLLVPGNDVRDHPVRDPRTHVLGQSDVAFQLLYGQTLLRVLLVLLLQLHAARNPVKNAFIHDGDTGEQVQVWAPKCHFQC